MIDFRYHVVSIVAVFLALALGLFVGSTTLQNSVVSSIQSKTNSVSRANDRLSTQLSTAQAQLRQNQAFDASLEPYAVSGRLTGESVMVVGAPGVDDGTRKALLTTLADAGATVTGDVRLQPALLDPEQETFLSALTERVVVPGHAVPTGTGADRAAAELADVLGTRPDERPVSASTVADVISTYSDGKLLSVAGGASLRPASLAVLLVPSPPSTTPDAQVTEAEQTLLFSLVAALDRTSLGAVVVGPTAAASSGGLLAAATGAPLLNGSVSTVTGDELVAGRIATVFALAEQAEGQSGHYGVGVQPALPTPSPSP